MQVTISKATEIIISLIKAKIVPIVIGSPGIGKSQMNEQICNMFKLKMIDCRLSQSDPTDLNGFPMNEGGRATYVPMDTFPIEGDKIPEGYDGWMLFLDELTSASRAVQAAAYKLILDRKVGQHNLHPKVVIVAAGNRSTDGAIVEEISTALQSRMAWIDLVIDPKEWITWAESNKIDHRITDYIKAFDEKLYTFKPDHTDHTYGCPRSWEFLNRVMGDFDKSHFFAMASGIISEGLAHEFITYCEVYKEIPTVEQIIKAPETTHVPDEPSYLYALTGTVANKFETKNAVPLIKYIERLPYEFQIVLFREVGRRTPGILQSAEVDAWATKLSSEIG